MTYLVYLVHIDVITMFVDSLDIVIESTNMIFVSYIEFFLNI